MSNTSANINVVRNEDGGVNFSKSQTQSFDPEAFLDVYNDSVQQFKQMKQQIQQFKDKRENTLEEEEESIAAINYLLGNETPLNPDDAGELRDAMNEDAFEKHQEIKQTRNQINQLEKRKDQVKQEIDAMKAVAEDVADELGEETENIEEE